MATANHIQIRNINQGGIADSDYFGMQNSVAECVGLDIHSESGIIKLNQKLTKLTDTGAAVDELIRAIVPASTGDTYFFGGTNGKIWKLTSGGTWSLVRTANPAAGTAGILAAREYQGYIYYATQSRLGRFDLASTWDDNYATFTKTDTTYHPMAEVNLVLYIGDGAQVAQVDAGTFSASALDISTPLRVSALGVMGTDLLIGTYVASNIVKTQIFRWNTWSDSFSVSDEIPEVGVNAFLATDNRIIVSAGTKGNLYMYNGQQLELYKHIKGTWSSLNKAFVHDAAVLNYNGLPLFGLSTSYGTGVNLGVYSIGRTNPSYPYVLNLDYPISTGNLTKVTVGAMAGYGDTFFVAWKDETGASPTYGVDNLDLSNKYATGYFTTRVSLFDRIVNSTYKTITAPYRSLPTGTSIQIYVSKNHGAFTEITDLINDTDRLQVSTDAYVGEATTMQVKVLLNGTSNNSPELEMLDIEVQ